MKYNAIYVCCIDNPWLDVVDILYKKHNIYPSYFIGWKDDNSHSIQNKYKNCFYQTVEDAWKGKGTIQFDYFDLVDMKDIEKFATEQIIAIKMMDRLDIDRYSFNFSDRQVFFYQLLQYWVTVLNRRKIKIAIFPVTPHRVFDYILYIACKIHNITTIMFQMTPFNDASYIIDDIDHMPDYIIKALNNSNNIKPLNNIIKKEIDNKRKDYQKAIPYYMKEQEQNSKFQINFTKKLLHICKRLVHSFEMSNSYHIQKNKTPFNSNFNNFEYKLKRLLNEIYLKRLLNEYNSLCINSSEISKKFILVALHYQPEETTVPSGGLFYDQILIISMLDSILPKDIDIIVKEHKSQFYKEYEGATGRTKNYYKNINNISKRVKLVNTDLDPFKLIEKAIFTVTVTGTIGWESAIRMTPAIHFGRAWYENMPGTYRIKDAKTLKSSIKIILNKEYSYTLQDIYNYHSKLSDFFIYAIHYKAYQDISNRDIKESAIIISEAIFNYLKQQKIIKD